MAICLKLKEYSNTKITICLSLKILYTHYYVFPLVDTTREHFSFTIALGMRTFVVVTKIDMCQGHTTKKVVEQVEKLLISYKKIPVVVKDDEEVLVTAQNFLNDKYVYILLVQCIYGYNYLYLILVSSQYLWSPV